MLPGLSDVIENCDGYFVDAGIYNVHVFIEESRAAKAFMFCDCFLMYFPAKLVCVFVFKVIVFVVIF